MFFTKFPKTVYDFYLNKRSTDIPNLFRQIRSRDSRFDDISAYELYDINESRPDQVSYSLYGTTDHYWTFFIVNKHLEKGMNSWPLRYVDLQTYLDTNYNYHSIRPYRTGGDVNINAIASRFNIGDSVYRKDSGGNIDNTVQGTIIKRDINTNQLFFTYETAQEFADSDWIWVGNEPVDQLQTGPTPTPNFELTTGKYATHHFEDSDGNIIGNYNNYLYSGEKVTNETYEVNANDDKRKIRVIRQTYINDFSILFRQMMNDG